jgi:AAA+ superfamily predicted ATPase
MSDLGDLQLIVAARTALVFIETAEPDRAEALFRRISMASRRPLFRWSLAIGLTRLDGQFAPQKFNMKPIDVLGQILSTNAPGIYLLLDLQRFLDEPETISQLREIATRCESVPHTLAIVGAELKIPSELTPFSARFDLALPTAAELELLVLREADATAHTTGQRVQTDSAAVQTLARNLAGLSHADAQRLIRNAVADGVLDDSDVPAVMSAKYKLLDQGGVLSFELKPPKLDEVAGLANLKRWLSLRRDVFVADQPPPGLDPPKGVLLLGVQGGGKSLAAKACAGAWGVPLLRLDFATLYNKFYGETERNLRESLKTAGVMAPCVVWIDEIEKGLATDDGADGGPSKRILGTLLTWMAEHKDRVFLVATANDIEALPPELLRKGRFDEIFFVDLPAPPVRAKIFEIHLRKRGQDPVTFDLNALAAATDGFSGAEIEQAVVAALYAAHARKTALATQDVVVEIKATRPLSVVMAEKITALRAWANGRTVSAD